MRSFIFYLLTTFLWSSACGAGKTVSVVDSTEDNRLRHESSHTEKLLSLSPILSRAEFTDLADTERYRVLGNVKTDFEPSQSVIYFVGQLENVPEYAEIEATWYYETETEPFLSSTIQGEGKFSFVSDLHQVDKPFQPGHYYVKIFVNGYETGKAGFEVNLAELPADATSTRDRILADPNDSNKISKENINKTSSRNKPSVSRVSLGTSVGLDNMPQKSSSSFSSSDKSIFCGLQFSQLLPGSEIVLLWILVDKGREYTYFTTKTLVPEGGSGTMQAKWETTDGFEPGAYKLVVKIDDKIAAVRKFGVTEAD